MAFRDIYEFAHYGVKRVVKEQKIYRENSKKCKSCIKYNMCKNMFEYHDVYRMKVKIKPKSIACSKHEHK